MHSSSCLQSHPWHDTGHLRQEHILLGRLHQHMSLSAFFLNAASGPLFCVVYAPSAGCERRGGVLLAQPFAEEQNKCRRMVALQARALVREGWVVMVPDLYGCGDSAGEFGEADWIGWQGDLSACVNHLRQTETGPLVFWGIRTGCMLLSQLAQLPDAPKPAASVFWQPVLDGDLFLMQFLRLRMATGMMEGRKESTRELRARLDAGESLEVAGYSLSSKLAHGLAESRLEPPMTGPVHWFEVVTSDDSGLAAQSSRCIDSWRSMGITVHAATCTGVPFWSAQEIREVPGLIELTRDAMASTERDVRL